MPENKPAYPHPEAKPAGGKRYFDKKPEKKFGEKKFGDKKFGDRKFGEKKFGDRDKRFGDKKPERHFDRKDSGEKRFPHPEAKPVSGAPAPQKAFPHPEAKPVAASEDRPRFARPTVRPAGPAPHEHNRKPAPAKRPVERQENPRQTALNILQDVSRGGAYASLALGERLRNSKLSQRDRDFVSALVYGVLEKRITLDWLIDGRLTREGDLESLVRDMLRLGLYQILYMTRVQRERFLDQEEYERLKDRCILTKEKLAQAKADLCILHPLPRVNEISTEIDADPRAAYFRQARYGKFIRMALILKLLGLCGGLEEAKTEPKKWLKDGYICRNPHCVTAAEPELSPAFIRIPGRDGARCAYCEAEAEKRGTSA